MILVSDANSKLLIFTKKPRKDKGKRGINMVTWSLPPFAVNVILSVSNVKRKRT